MDEEDQDVKAAKEALRDAIGSIPAELGGLMGQTTVNGAALAEAVEALIEAKLVALINELSERIEAKLGVVV
jgi:hypothetical protein